MPATGKTNASRVQVGDRILMDTATGFPSQTKTGANVVVARVTGKHAVQGGLTSSRRGTSRMRYAVITTAGEFNAAPIQTMWMAPEDNAGIKRAHTEALAEDVKRTAQVEMDEATANQATPQYRHFAEVTRTASDYRAALDVLHTEALAEDAERTAAQEETLTLHSHAGKVDNMNNDASTDQAQTTPAQPENHTGSTVVTLLERVWSRIRADHPELPEVVIITGSGLVGASKWGHFRANGWKVTGTQGGATAKHELFLAGEALAKGARQTLQTMLHEAAHTLAKVRNQQDTSRQGRWHNATFRKTADEMGLEHKSSVADKTHGFSFVTLTPKTIERYADLLAELEAEIKLTCHLPLWMGGTADQDEEDKGGEKITGKPAQGEDGKAKTGPLKAVCGCAEPLIIRLSQKVLDMRVVRCDECECLFTAA